MKRRGRPPNVPTSHEIQRWENWIETCNQVKKSNQLLKIRNQDIFTRREAGEKIEVLASEYGISIGRVFQVWKALKKGPTLIGER